MCVTLGPAFILSAGCGVKKNYANFVNLFEKCPKITEKGKFTVPFPPPPFNFTVMKFAVQFYSDQYSSCS